MATIVNTLDDANSIAKTASKAQPITVCVYQTGAAKFAVAYDSEAVRGVLVGQYRNGFCVADPRGVSPLKEAA